MPADYQYIKDVTIPDEMKIAVGTPFVKTWRVRNTGSVAWTEGFSIRFAKGHPMTDDTEQPLPFCAPGDEVEISLALTVPLQTGRHYGDWFLRDADGQVFGDVIYLVVQARTPAEIAGGMTDADMVADVTIPDDTVIPVGERFEKVWRVRNTGNVPWTEDFRLVHVDGKAMTGITKVSLPETKVGALADVTLALTAPYKSGSYYGDWRFQDANGRVFGDIIHLRINALPDEDNLGINDSTFVKNVTVPHDMQMQPGESFTKTWIARNSGTKAWDETYVLRFIEGNAMTTQTDVPLPPTEPGQEVAISVTLTAPLTLGRHYCDWKMIDGDNNPFGDIFWTRIEVPTADDTQKPEETREDNAVGTVRVQPRLQAPAPFYSQRDPRWADNQLGNSPSQTIASWGCMMTCKAMILHGRGYETDPGRLNDLLRQRGLYYNGYITQWRTANMVEPSVIYDTHIENHQRTQAIITQINDYLQRGLPVMVNVDLNPRNAYNSNIEQHWVLIVGQDEENDDYLIYDPASLEEQVISLKEKYGYFGEPLWKAIQQAVFYS